MGLLFEAVGAGGLRADVLLRASLAAALYALLLEEAFLATSVLVLMSTNWKGATEMLEGTTTFA